MKPGSDIRISAASVEIIRSLLGGKGMLLLAGAHRMMLALLDMISNELRCAGKTIVALDGRLDETSSSAAVVGRITDAALAGTAVAANIRGHLVVVTTPALDAIGAMQTMVDSGVDPALVMDLQPVVITIHGVRRLCAVCSEPVGRLTAREQRLVRQYSMTPLFRAVGCIECNGSGFAGAIPYAQISLGASPVPVDDYSWAEELLATGQTSIEELARLLGPPVPHAACA